MRGRNLLLSCTVIPLLVGCGELESDEPLQGLRNTSMLGIECPAGQVAVAGSCVASDTAVELRLVRGQVRMFTAENGCWDMKWVDGAVNEDMETEKQNSGFMPDPMVEVSNGKTRQLSDMIDNTTRPDWHDQMLLMAPAADWLETKLMLTVYDAEFIGNKPNRILTGKQLMDSCVVPITGEDLARGTLTVAPCGERTGTYLPAEGTSDEPVSLVKKIELRFTPAQPAPSE